MRASVRDDTTTRIITLEVSGVPDVDVTENWHHRPRMIRPDHATIRLVNGQFREFNASGPVVKVNGEPGGNRDTWKCYETGERFQRDTLDQAPEWVRTLVREAPEGVTAWTAPEEVPA